MVGLFSYGTLQQPEVQLGTFGRLLEGHPDSLSGHVLVPLKITDPKVVELSGAEVHLIACPTAGATEPINGLVFELSPEELAAADRYEVDVYDRVQVSLHRAAKPSLTLAHQYKACSRIVPLGISGRNVHKARPHGCRPRKVQLQPAGGLYALRRFADLRSRGRN